MKKTRSRSKTYGKEIKKTELPKPGMNPKPPKEPLSAFMRFRDEVLAKYKQKMPDRTMASITQTIAEKWEEMNDSQKGKYNKEFLDDLNKYIKDLREYERKYGRTRHRHLSVDDPPLEGMYYSSVAGTGKLIKLKPENKLEGHKGASRKRQEALSEDEEETHEEEGEETAEEETEEKEKPSKKKVSRARRERHPSPPKRPQTGFFLFKSEKFDQMKKKHPRGNAVEISSLLADEWRDLNERTKKKYENKHEKLMQQYEKDMEEYEAQYGKVQRKRRPRSPESPTRQKLKMDPYVMKVKDRPGNRPQILPSEGLIGNKLRDPARRRVWPEPI